MSYRLIHGDCRSVLTTLADGSVDCVITDPPYPHILREYGYWTEAEWFNLMRVVVRECRRILKPTGSAVFILQPNGERVGSVRPWLWDFMGWACREWNQVQDAWWWNIAASPVANGASCGLMRSSLKACVWLGESDCYRDQGAVLWSESDKAKVLRTTDRVDRERPSGWRGKENRARVDYRRRYDVAVGRGGVTPFNVIPCGPARMAGKEGHSAATPPFLVDYWVRYISPPSGVVLDPFAGSGTTGVAALSLGRSFIGIESYEPYIDMARSRLDGPPLPLFETAAPVRSDTFAFLSAPEGP